MAVCVQRIFFRSCSNLARSGTIFNMNMFFIADASSTAGLFSTIIVYIDLIFWGRENTGDYFPRLGGATEVNMVREIIKPVFSRLMEMRVLSQENTPAHHCLFTRTA